MSQSDFNNAALFGRLDEISRNLAEGLRPDITTMRCALRSNKPLGVLAVLWEHACDEGREAVVVSAAHAHKVAVLSWVADRMPLSPPTSMLAYAKTFSPDFVELDEEGNPVDNGQDAHRCRQLLEAHGVVQREVVAWLLADADLRCQWLWRAWDELDEMPADLVEIAYHHHLTDRAGGRPSFSVPPLPGLVMAYERQLLARELPAGQGCAPRSARL